MKKIILYLILLMLVSFPAYAIDCTSATTVNNAISAASVGATITCSGAGWSSGTVSISKAVTLDGNGASVGGSISVTASSTGVVRVTDFTFTRSGSNTIYAETSSGSEPFRIDHVTVSGYAHEEVNIYGRGPGLFDNCTFIGNGNGAYEYFHILGAGAESSAGWTDSITPGTEEQIYFEDCLFDAGGSYDNWIDGYYGCRYTIRYSTLDQFNPETHGNTYAGRWYEIYKNTFTGGASVCLRGGSGIIFDNTGSPYMRMVEEFSNCSGGQSGCDEIGKGQNWELYPLYYWDSGTGALNASGCSNTPISGAVVLNTDVYNLSSTQGTSLPATCTTGQGYWKTDAGGNWDTINGGANDGALYKCTSTNNWTLYYTPLQYPHPSIEGVTPDTTAPTLSTFIVQSSGTTVITTFDETVTESGTGSNWSFTMSGGAVTLSSPSVNGSAITYTTNRAINYNETISSISYTQPGNGIEDSAGNDLATILDASAKFTNESSYGASIDFIDDSRITDWSNAGLTSIGGIPNRTDICTTLSSGVTVAQINSAISSCSSGGGGVVKLNAGTYNIGTGSTPITMASNVTLRGAGMSSTILSGALSWHMIQFGSYPSAPVSTSVSGSLTKGATEITVGSISSPLINTTTKRFIVIDQIADSVEVSTTAQDGNDYSDRTGNRWLAEMVEVKATNGTTLTIDPPLHHGFSSAQSPQVWVVPQGITMITLAGIEDMTINRTSGSNGAGYNNIKMVASAYCWIKNVKSIRPDWWHVDIEQSFRNEVRNSYFDRGWGYSSPYYPYGVVVGYCSADNLVENNVFYHLRHSMVVKYGAVGNVYGYNYSLESIMDDSTYLSGDIEPHGGHNTYNLFEGNIVSKIYSDYTHGSSSYNTFFRNFSAGDSSALTTTAARYAVDADVFNTYNNYMGNVLGNNSYAFANGCETGSTRNVGSRYIWSFGFGSDGDSSRDSTLPETTAWRHGNWDYCNDAITWENSNHTIPDSYYLTSTPDWFGALTWPNIDPITQTVSDNPAKVFYETGSWPTGAMPSPPTRVIFID